MKRTKKMRKMKNWQIKTKNMIKNNKLYISKELNQDIKFFNKIKVHKNKLLTFLLIL